MTEAMDPEREREALRSLTELAERDAKELDRQRRFARLQERERYRRPRPRILPPGNWSVQVILVIERLINDGAQLSVMETEWQRDRRLLNQ